MPTPDALTAILDRATLRAASRRLAQPAPDLDDPDDYRAVTPGGVLVYGDPRGEQTVAFGRSQTAPADDDAPPDRAGFAVTADTIYDLASLTKPIATAGAMMRLAGRGLDLDAPARTLLPELSGAGKDRITFAHLLGHGSGFPAHIEFFRRLLAGERHGDGRRESLLHMVAQTPLAHDPGTVTIYSDLGYILLGFAIERATGQRLDEAVAGLVTRPLGMRQTGFADLDAPPGERAVPADRTAPTEVCPYRGLVRAEVHDDNAHAAGGICGHAGLFATAGDVARFARAIAAALAGRDGAAPFAPEVVARFVDTGAAPDTTWRLGWDRPSPPPVVSHFGDRWSRDSIGHTGFTGTGVWIEPDTGRYAVLLTNRVHPARDNPGIRGLRRAVTDAVHAQPAGTV